MTRVTRENHVVGRVATHDAETVRIIETALGARIPLALFHPKLTSDELARQRAALEAATLQADDAVILFTSGSTGASKGVVLSRAAIDAATEATWQHLGEHDNDQWMCALPLAHAGGLSILVRCGARARARIASTCTLRDGDTLASLVPAQLADLLEDPAWTPPPTLRAVLLGGAAAPPSLIDAAIRRGVPVLPSYGMTETFGQIATARIPGGPLHLLPGVTVTGGTRAAPALLRVRAPMLASRYLDGTPIAPELVTSDLGFVEGDTLHVIGRADDVIISGGENVHPAQVEAVLAATPGVLAAVAFGVSDPRYGQVVAAAIVVDRRFERGAALASWHERLPPFARPRRLAIVTELPRLASGKLDRRRAATLATSPIDYAR